MIRINDKVTLNDIYRSDLHMHTVFCDGKNTPEEMVCSAIDKGFECIGFSGHSFVEFDLECGMDAEHAAAYFEEVSRLKDKYRDRIRIFCGIEQDYFSETATDQYDYVIGSVHYVPVNPEAASCEYISVDNTPQILIKGVQDFFDNDYYAMAERYYELVADVINRTGADIIGHFDLVSKFNETCRLFDEHHPRYIAAWHQAADKLISMNKVFEINTGAISRGWRTVPYPAPEMMDYIKERGGRFILSSDSHAAENIGFKFDECRSIRFSLRSL